MNKSITQGAPVNLGIADDRLNYHEISLSSKGEGPKALEFEAIKKHYSRSLENSPQSKKLNIRELGYLGRENSVGNQNLSIDGRFNRYKKTSDQNLRRHPAGISTNQNAVLVPTYNSKSVDASLKPNIEANQDAYENSVHTVKKSRDHNRHQIKRNHSDTSQHSYQRSKHLRPIQNLYKEGREIFETDPVHVSYQDAEINARTPLKKALDPYEVGSPQSRKYDVITNLPKQKILSMPKIEQSGQRPGVVDLDADFQTLDRKLTELQGLKKLIEGDLCKIPEHPKKHGIREKKDQLEDELRNVNRTIGELKRTLRYV